MNLEEVNMKMKKLLAVVMVMSLLPVGAVTEGA